METTMSEFCGSLEKEGNRAADKWDAFELFSYLFFIYSFMRESSASTCSNNRSNDLWACVIWQDSWESLSRVAAQIKALNTIRGR